MSLTVICTSILQRNDINIGIMQSQFRFKAVELVANDSVDSEIKNIRQKRLQMASILAPLLRQREKHCPFRMRMDETSNNKQNMMY